MLESQFDVVRWISEPVAPDTWPVAGHVSADQVATIGLGHIAFLFKGTNNYYDAYMPRRSDVTASRWAELVDGRHRRFATAGVPFVSLFVPNKATMLGSEYPFILRERVSPDWGLLKRCLRDNPGVLFADEAEVRVSNHRWSASALWRRVDSHWSVIGCLAATNSVLTRFGLMQLDPPVVEVNQEAWGDLSSRWQTEPIRERMLFAVRDQEVDLGLPSPTVTFDSGTARSQLLGVGGRRITWENPEAPYPARLCIIGNSFSGPGDRPEHISWWMSRLFRRVTFVHSASIPSDLLEKESPDLVLFQGLERFLNTIPNDECSLADLDEAYSREVRRVDG